MNEWVEIILTCIMIGFNPRSGNQSRFSDANIIWIRILCLVIILLLIPIAIIQIVIDAFANIWSIEEKKDLNCIIPSCHHPTSQIKSEKSILNVFFLNLGCLPNWISPINDMRSCVERIEEFCDVLIPLDPDVCCFVELMDSKSIEKIKKKLKNIYPYQMYHIGGQSHFQFSSGYAILSKYPFEKDQVRFESFLSKEGSDAWANKGIATIPILLRPDYAFEVSIVHMQSDSEGDKASIRRSQWTQMNAYMEKHIPKSNVQFEMVVGDFNWTPQEYRTFYESESKEWCDLNLHNIKKGDRTFYYVQEQNQKNKGWGHSNWNQQLDHSSYLDYVFLYKRNSNLELTSSQPNEFKKIKIPSHYYVEVVPYNGNKNSSYSDHLAIQVFLWLGSSHPK
jgi:endonuclease/exonuclease/phosphatase family metal-dependent hydrolase